MDAEVAKQVAQETAWISSAWGYLLGTAIGAAFGGFTGAIALEVYRGWNGKRHARKRLEYIMVELRRGVNRCKGMAEKLERDNEFSFAVISTKVWDSSDDLESLTRVVGRDNVKKINFIHEWFWQVNSNAILNRPGPAVAFAKYAIDHEKIEDFLFQLEAALADKTKR